MAELPDQLDVSVTLGGQPLPGAWVELRLLMDRKQDYLLIVGPADAAGALSRSRGELEDQISVIQLSAFMDYASVGIWRGELILSPFDAEALTRARERLEHWPRELRKTYPADAAAQFSAVAEALAAAPGLALELTATARGGSAQLTCLASTS